MRDSADQIYPDMHEPRITHPELDLHDLGFFSLEVVVDLFDGFVG